MIKWAILALGVTAALTLTAVPVFAQQIRLSAALSGGNEIPKVTTGSFGSAECTVDLGTGIISCTGEVFNMPSGVLFGHIHVGSDGVVGPIVCNGTMTPNLSNEFGFTVFCNSSNILLREGIGIRSFEDFVQAVLGENSYINIHSAVNPGGEIRGQLLRKP